MESRRASRTTRVENMRRSIHQLFTGRSVMGRPATPDGPKTPRLELGLHNFSSTRLDLPEIFRSTIAPAAMPMPSNSMTSPRIPSSTHSPISPRPITPHSFGEIQRSMSMPQPVARSYSRQFVGVDPEEQHLADLAARGRRRRSRRGRSRRKTRSCIISPMQRKMRSKVMACAFSALFLMIVLTIYLALALSNREESQEFHVLLILIILLTAIFFCHSLISLCLAAIRPPDAEHQPSMSMTGRAGFANPPQPIRVALVRDEEAAGIVSEATKFPPPAYGLWRESVRVDPDRIFWQRNEAARIQNSHISGTVRPPSYISEDGVNYVLEAAPRSIAPTTDVPLAPHPSGHNRVHIL